LETAAVYTGIGFGGACNCRAYHAARRA